MISKKWAFCFCNFETTGILDSSLPIEVGCIWTDSDFSTIDTYDSLVMWPELEKENHWPQKYMGAYNIHKIDWLEYIDNSVDVGKAARDIWNKNNQLLKKYKRVILLSDNAKFETQHMKKLFDYAELIWNFHYCTWDSSTLLFATDVGDPKPEHRAFRDASLLQKAMIEAMDRTKHFRRDE